MEEQVQLHGMASKRRPVNDSEWQQGIPGRLIAFETLHRPSMYSLFKFKPLSLPGEVFFASLLLPHLFGVESIQMAALSKELMVCWGL